MTQMTAYEEVNRDIRKIRKRMRRFKETGDIKRAARLIPKAMEVQAKIDLLTEAIRVRRAETRAARFRRSYAFDGWRDELAEGGQQNDS